jgi:hypothetical protein
MRRKDTRRTVEAKGHIIRANQKAGVYGGGRFVAWNMM